jgi:DNA-binding response OmpR family regulator
MSINKQLPHHEDKIFHFSDLTIDIENQYIIRNQNKCRLNPKESKLLYLLLQNADQITSRKEIMETVWETSYLGDTRTLDVHIRWLREKIEVTPSRPRHLITVRGVGYHFITNPE